MVSGTALVSTAYPAVFEYAKDGENALLSPVKDVQALANNIIKLIKDDKLRCRLANNGIETMKSFNWDDRTDMLEQYLKEKTPKY